MTQLLRRNWRWILVVFALSSALFSGTLFAGPRESVPGATERSLHVFPSMRLRARTYGEEAIAELGDKLPDVAAFYNRTPAEFRRRLREDRSAWVDTDGRMLFIDYFPQQADGSQAIEPLPAAPYPLSETFTLNSRPDSRRVIYLDFDGHVTTGTAWNQSSGVNSIYSPPYTRDGSPGFSDLELEYIQDMWRQVAEDFAPFDVNVTTQDPGQAAITRSSLSDQYYGTRVIITEDNFDNCGCGGFAYLTAFNDVGDYYKPAFVFNRGLVSAGEAISHEVGHNLSLSHDGTIGGASYYTGHGNGSTGWAPIMGVGYYQLLVQWSQGEYSGANQFEDDIAQIQAYGAPLVADDHGDSDTTATLMQASSNGSTVSLSGAGMIRNRQDVDVFSFISGSGSYSINVSPAPYSANLDVEARLYNSDGTLVASVNPLDSLPATLSGVLSEGEYFLAIDGVGRGDPQGTGYSDYGSLGQYTISGTVSETRSLSPPTAVVEMTPDGSSPYYSPLYVSFDGSGSVDSDGNSNESIADWTWNFGDGNGASDDATVNHTYTAPGSYTVTLTVTDNNGLSDSDNVTVVVDNQAPVATGSADITSGEAPLTISFSGDASQDPDSSGSVVSYNWIFGDGSSSSLANPSHTYTSAFAGDVTLTVTDNLGATDSTAISLDITAPPSVDQLDQYASAEQFAAGTVSGSYLDTHGAEGIEQSVREQLSSGSRRRGYSYLEHTWIFDIQPGSAANLFITGRQSNSSDGDQMLFEYSVDSGPYQPLPITLGTSATSFVDVPLALAAAGGVVSVRVTDTDRTARHTSLDTVFIDQIFIRTQNGDGEPPAPPPPPPPPPPTPPTSASNLGATAISSSQVDLSWRDNSGDETGFRIERSFDGANWALAATVGPDQESYSDTGLYSYTTYYYQVLAYNGNGNAVSSNTASATTQDIGSENIDLSATTNISRRRNSTDLSWSPVTGTVQIFRDGFPLITTAATSYRDNLGRSPDASYTYQVCMVSQPDQCSNEVIVTF